MWFQETPGCQWSHSEFPGAASGGEESQEQTSEKLLFSHSSYCLGQNTHTKIYSFLMHLELYHAILSK